MASSLSYSAWFLASQEAAMGKSPMASLFMVMTVALAITIILNMGGLGRVRPSSVLRAMGGGLLFAIGNLLFYTMIPLSGLGLASAFSSLSLLLFSLLILPKVRPRTTLLYVTGSALSALGVGGLSYAHHGGASYYGALLGVAIAVLYALGTYVLYMSISSSGVAGPSIGIFVGELLFFSPSFVLPHSPPALVWTTVAGASLAVALNLEARGFKALIPHEKEAIGNVLSSLELLPVAIYYLVVYGPMAYLYATMLGVTVVGLVLLSLST
ncbi:MAG: hypothetical protein ACP5HK_00710 [Acidilobus sp.]